MPLDDTPDVSEVAATTHEPQWLIIARGELGVHRRKDHREPRIAEYFAHTSLGPSPDTVSWCSAFANFCIDKAGLHGTGNAMARSWLHWGVHTEVRIGAIAVLPRAGDPNLGHVGMVERFDAEWVWLLAGNQGATNRDGSDSKVCIKRFPRDAFLDFRWPKSVTQSRTMQAAGGVATAVTAKVATDVVTSDDAGSSVVGTVKDLAVEHGPALAGRVIEHATEQKADHDRPTYEPTDGGHPVIAIPEPARVHHNYHLAFNIAFGVVVLALVGFIVWERWKRNDLHAPNWLKGLAFWRS